MAEHAHSSYTVRGYCALCTAHCATVASVKDGRVVRLDADSDHPNGGVLCIKDKDWMLVESPRGGIRAKARVTETIAPGVVCCQHGWWQECKDLELPGYDSYGRASANPSLLIGSELADPISGSLPHRSYLCRVRPLG